MKTSIFSCSERGSLKQAAKLLVQGNLVAFPTETVYGLGANALDPEAVMKIFQVKKRPQDNPLIVHIAKEEQIQELVTYISEKSKILMKTFWPGPLTIIFEKKEVVPAIVSANLPYVALRMPSHPCALALLREANVPIVAPSANLSGRPSPTKAEHVREDLRGKISCILDGGQVPIGIESTVIDMTTEPPTLLRPGKITKEEIEKSIGSITTKTTKLEEHKSPGMKYKHYSPKAKVILFKEEKDIRELLAKKQKESPLVLVYSNAEEMAHSLFADFRSADAKGHKIIFVQEIEEKGFGEAVMNRLRKAAAKK